MTEFKINPLIFLLELPVSNDYKTASKQCKSGIYRDFFNILKHENLSVIRVTLVLWIGNETLRKAYTIWEWPSAWRLSETRIESCQFNGWWRGSHPQRSHVSYNGECTICFSDFSAKEGPCRQREELGSKCSVSFPIQRTRVTQVTQDILFHRFTRHCVKLTRFENYIPLPGPITNQKHTRLVQTDRTWEHGAVSRSKL